MNQCGNEYIQLLSSLPRMPSQIVSDYHPITDITLNKRLQLLSPTDRQRLQNIQSVVLWSRVAKFTQQEDLVSKTQAIAQVETDTHLAQLIRYRIDVRTVVAALILRQQGQAPTGKWTLSRFKRQLEQQWQVHDFGLSQRLAWVGEAANLVRSGDSLALEKLIVELCWLHLQRSPARLTYGFEAVVVYVMQWDLITRQQQWDGELAQLKFNQLLANLTDQKEWQHELQHKISDY